MKLRRKEPCLVVPEAGTRSRSCSSGREDASQSDPSVYLAGTRTMSKDVPGRLGRNPSRHWPMKEKDTKSSEAIHQARFREKGIPSCIALASESHRVPLHRRVIGSRWCSASETT
jgi:hypothetical protein